MLNEKLNLLRDAILNRKQVTGICESYHREFCPHLLGTKNGRWHVFGWQFAGGSNHSLPPGGQWRCFEVSSLINLSTRLGEWHRGYTAGKRDQFCIDQIDTRIDPSHAAETR
jgi:hypothetical protein